MKKAVNRFLRVSSSDPDEARRRSLLNIILIGAGFLSVIILALTFILAGFQLTQTPFGEMAWVAFAAGGFLVGTTVLFIINRAQRIPGWVASTLFLIFTLVVLGFSDTPTELAAGRSLFVFAIPVVMSSLLLRPIFSFIFAALVSLEIYILGSFSPQEPNPVAMISYFLVALVSWLSSRGMEQAITELRQTNANLDHLVQERTRELASALARERVELGRSKAILESIADGVIVFDLRGAAIVANPSSVKLLNIPYEQILGATIDDLSESQSLDSRNRGLLAGLLTSPGKELTSYRVQWGRKTLSVTAAEVNDMEGTHLGVVAVFRDYTREAEVERMKNTFLAIVSHELRTPLNAILGYAEMLKEAVYGSVNDKQLRASERIMSNSHRLLDIVSDLLDQAQMEAGKLTIHMRAFRPADLVDNVHGVMDKIAADKGLIVTSELDPALPEFINGDLARLQQILVNLINNAVKFTETGSVHMHLSRSDKKCWRLEVRDTGIGIPQEELATIFEAFRQVDSSATRKHGGFGLGLSIVKQLSELMGGEVVVTSKMGAGSAFIVTLPLIPARRRLIK